MKRVTIASRSIPVVWGDRRRRRSTIGATVLMLALVALPPEFGGIVGARGGLFILAGCSPSNHEGRGQPSDLWAVYDIATSGYTIGKLPAATGAGTSACRHGDRLIIKRGGVQEREGDAQVWIVRTLAVDVAARARAKQRVVSPDLSAIDRMEIQFQSAGDRFTIWIDGLKFARNP